MRRVLKALVSPVKLVLLTAVILAVAVGTGHILPKAHAADECGDNCLVQSEDCPEGWVMQEGECTNPDLCPNLDGVQTVVPAGYHLTDKDSTCAPDQGQVLGESTTVSDPGTTTQPPQVLGVSIGK